MNLYRVTIGPRNEPRLSFEATAPDSMDCAMQHLSLTQPGECMRVDAVQAAGSAANRAYIAHSTNQQESEQA